MSTLSIAITGHRPGDLLHDGCRIDLAPALQAFLRRAAARARGAGHERVRVITGGALGVDQAVAAAVAAQPTVEGIAFEYSVVLPFPVEVMAKRWRPEDRGHLERLMAGAVETAVIAPAFDWGAYQQRNIAMVDAASMVVGFWSGKRRGGTYNCLRYALRQGKPTFNALEDFRLLRTEDLEIRAAK